MVCTYINRHLEYECHVDSLYIQGDDIHVCYTYMKMHMYMLKHIMTLLLLPGHLYIVGLRRIPVCTLNKCENKLVYNMQPLPHWE